MTVEIRSLQRSDNRQDFHSGDEALDVYFRRYAGQNQFRHHLGVTYVAVEGDRILGFVTVSAGSLDAVAFYDRYGFATLEVVEGASLVRPEPTLMFLPLGAVPPG